MLKVESFQRPDWTDLPFEGCHNVRSKSLQRFPDFALAMLKFEPDGTIHEHPADFDIDVYCLEGEGMVSMGDEQAPIKAGERVRWLAGHNHQLWTIGSPMITLMIEHEKTES